MLMNVISHNEDKALVHHLGNTVKTIFPSLFTLDLKGNVLFFAFKEKTSLEQIKTDLKNYPDKRINNLTEYALKNIQKFQERKGYPIFTDNWAPIENITYEMVKNMYNEDAEK